MLFLLCFSFLVTDLDELAWIAGSWASDDGKVEEHWMQPAGGIMVGMNRDNSKGKAFFEYLRLEQRDDGIFFVASPRGKSATEFRLTDLTGKKAVFENPDHDFPKKIVYRLEAADKLCARVEADGKGFGWCWQRIAR